MEKQHLDFYDLIGKDSPEKVQMNIANNIKKMRKNRGMSQAELAKASMVSFASYRIFEKSGKIALSSLIRIAFALGIEGDFAKLFKPEEHISYEEFFK